MRKAEDWVREWDSGIRPGTEEFADVLAFFRNIQRESYTSGFEDGRRNGMSWKQVMKLHRMKP